MEKMAEAASSEGILVGIRMRPLNDREVTAGQEKIFKCMNTYNAITQLTKDGHAVEGQMYYYDKVFDERASTVDVYSQIGKDIVKGVVSGINGTIFACTYPQHSRENSHHSHRTQLTRFSPSFLRTRHTDGQTSSGKTHTMLGNQKDQRGVLEMAAEDIFTHICNTSGRDFLLRVSFVEIYNEIIRDLLSDAADATVNIREDPRRGVYCEAGETLVTDYDSIIRALKKGTSRRTVEATAMNDTSSRSHTIFKLVIESKENSSSGNPDPDGAVLVSTLNLVDLVRDSLYSIYSFTFPSTHHHQHFLFSHKAGSESVRHTGATGQRAKEGGKINQSLLSLSRVIHALSQPGAHVSFRDSKLTRLLQPSLCGNAKMSVVCCITPAERYLEETRSTLQFASRAKLVKTHAVVNEVLDEAAALKRLKKELEELKEKQRGIGVSEEEHARIEAEKAELHGRLQSLEREKEAQSQRIERLKELIVAGEKNSASDKAVIDKAKRRKRHRDTWCPGGVGFTGLQLLPSAAAAGTVCTDILIDDMDMDDVGSAADRSAGSSKSDTSTGSAIVQALSAQLAARDDIIEALRDQLRSAQGGVRSRSLEGEDEEEEELDEEEEGDDDTVPLEESVPPAEVAEALSEALVKVNSLEAVVESRDAALAQLRDDMAVLEHRVAASSESDAQTEALLRGLEEDAARSRADLAGMSNLLSASEEKVAELSRLLQAANEAATPSTEVDTVSTQATQEQLVALQSELASAEELIQEMEIEAASVRANLEESHSREESLVNALQDADAEVSALKLQITTLEGQLEGCLGDLDFARKEIAASAAAHTASLSESGRVHAEAIEAAKLALDAAVAETARLQESLIEVEGEVEALKTASVAATELAAATSDDAVSAAVAEAAEKSNAEIEALHERISSLEREILGREEGLAGLRAELATAAAKTEEAEEGLAGLRAELATAAAKTEEAEAATVAATAAAAAAASALASAQAAAAASATLVVSSGPAAAMHVHRQETDSQDLTQQDIEAARREMERTVEAMRAELGAREAEVSRLMAASAEWADRATRAERQEADYRSLANGVADGDAALRKKLAQLQTQVDLLRSEKDVASKRLAEAETELRAQAGRAAVAEESLQTQLQTQSQRIEKLTAGAGEAQRLAESVRALEARATEVRAERDEAKSFGAAAAARVTELEALLEKTQTLAFAAASTSGGSEAKIDSLQSELAEARARCDEVKRDAEEAAGRFKKGREEMSLLRGEWERCEQQLKVSEASKLQLAAQLEEALGQVQALTDALTEAESLTMTLPMATTSAADQEKIALLQAREAELSAELANTLQRCTDAEEAMAESENKVGAAATAEAAAKAKLQAAEGRIAQAEAQGEAHAEALRSGRVQAKAAVEGLQQRLAAAGEEARALRDDLTAKDLRIAHLETTKLTQDQLNKIKAVKEERKRLSEDNKTMKRQLQALKKAYDDLKATAAPSASAGAGAGMDAADLAMQLEASKGLVLSLKDKLKECSEQLQVSGGDSCSSECAFVLSTHFFKNQYSSPTTPSRSTRPSARQWCLSSASTASTRVDSSRLICRSVRATRPLPSSAKTSRRQWHSSPPGSPPSWPLLRSSATPTRHRRTSSSPPLMWLLKSFRRSWRTATTCGPRCLNFRSCLNWPTGARQAAKTMCRARCRLSRRRTLS